MAEYETSYENKPGITKVCNLTGNYRNNAAYGITRSYNTNREKVNKNTRRAFAQREFQNESTDSNEYQNINHTGQAAECDYVCMTQHFRNNLKGDTEYLNEDVCDSGPSSVPLNNDEYERISTNFQALQNDVTRLRENTSQIVNPNTRGKSPSRGNKVATKTKNQNQRNPTDRYANGSVTPPLRPRRRRTQQNLRNSIVQRVAVWGPVKSAVIFITCCVIGAGIGVGSYIAISLTVSKGSQSNDKAVPAPDAQTLPNYTCNQSAKGNTTCPMETNEGTKLTVEFVKKTFKGAKDFCSKKKLTLLVLKDQGQYRDILCKLQCYENYKSKSSTYWIIYGDEKNGSCVFLDPGSHSEAKHYRAKSCNETRSSVCSSK